MRDIALCGVLAALAVGLVAGCGARIRQVVAE